MCVCWGGGGGGVVVAGRVCVGVVVVVVGVWGVGGRLLVRLCYSCVD